MYADKVKSDPTRPKGKPFMNQLVLFLVSIKIQWDSVLYFQLLLHRQMYCVEVISEQLKSQT